MHATEFLKNPSKHAPGPVVVLYGPQRHLKQSAFAAVATEVLGTDDDLALVRFDGKTADWKSVSDELLTVSMWGDRRLVAIDDADDFVTKNRPVLEKYLEKPAKKSVLVLTVKSFPSNTRLAKAVAKTGLPMECAELSGIALERWLGDTASRTYEKRLPREAAALIAELAGNDLGLLDQELAKLAAYVGERPQIETDDVAKLVGGWRTQTTWDMLDALQDGNVGAALSLLDRLLSAGEAPQMVLGGITFVYRRLAAATELSRQGMNLHAALKQAGVFGNKIDAAARYLRRIGRPRAERFHDFLLAADSGMKGSSRLPERLILESLLVHLGGQASGALAPRG
jgi:DNA polymerase-3 subunit delta